MTSVMISNTHRQRIAKSWRGQAAEYLGDIFALKATAQAALAIVFVCLELIPLHDISIRANDDCVKFSKYYVLKFFDIGRLVQYFVSPSFCEHRDHRAL